MLDCQKDYPSWRGFCVVTVRFNEVNTLMSPRKGLSALRRLCDERTLIPVGKTQITVRSKEVKTS